MATIRLSDISFTRGHIPQGRLWRAVNTAVSGHTRAFTLRHLTLTVPHGETLVLLGPSGCGKSTLLRIIAGLEAPDSGRVLYNGQDVAGIPPGDRHIGYLFQSYALYPHLTARENITSWFFFRRRTPELARLREEIFRRTAQLLDVDIAYLLDRKPGGLSGGEKQRVALGRCITREPELFLLDEPFSNLDAKLRAHYRLHLKTLLREFGITTVYVTHDQQEAVLLGDRIGIMRAHTSEVLNEGLLEQVGTVTELYEHPTNAFVADFLSLQPDVPPISFLQGHAIAPGLAGCTVGVRPEDVALGDGAPLPRLMATVASAVLDPLHQHRIVTLELPAGMLVAKLPPDTPAEPGQRVPVHFRHFHLFDQDSGEAVHPDQAAHAQLG